VSQEFSPLARDVRRAIFHRAFVDSLPVLMGYTTMGFVAGVLLGAKGDVVLSPVWAFLTSSLWVTGTMSIAGVAKIAERASVWTFVLMTLSVNFRYAFYGFTMLSRWRGVPFFKKLYLILMLTDENYALEAASKERDPQRYLRYCMTISALNHSYWIVGVTLGAFVVYCLGRLIDPELIRRYSSGMEFSMAALFLVILTDQIRELFTHGR